MRKIKILLITTSLLLLFGGCGGPKVTRTDTVTSGEAVFVADDCFARIMKEEMDVFVNTNVEASLTSIYVNESEALELLLKDSVRLAILARDLTDAEKRGITERNKALVARSQRIATDGLALIINPENIDSLISMESLIQVVTGEITSWKELNAGSKLGEMMVVFDNPRSSTVRFINDSLCRDKTMSSRLRALQNNQEVLDYVAKTPNAMGIIGVNWISNPVDTTNFTFTQQVRPMWVSRSHPATIASSFHPHAGYIATGDYPLRRDVYSVITDYRGTLLSGFVHFVAGDNGQRIVVKAGLVPATRPVRVINLKESF